METALPPHNWYPVKEKQTQHHESRLLNYLLSNYDRKVRPIVDHKKNVTVHLGITLARIVDLVRSTVVAIGKFTSAVL